MSSHHFVREGQEPALLIIDPVPFREAAELLEWAPLLVITENALEATLSWSVKIDVVICAPGREEDVYSCLQHQMPVGVLAESPSDWIKAGIDYMKNAGYSNIHLLTQRRNEVFRVLKDSEALQVTVFDNSHRWIQTKDFRKWVAARQAFQVFPESLVGDLKIEGLKLTLNEFHVERDGIISITGPSPFWVGEKI